MSLPHKDGVFQYSQSARSVYQQKPRNMIEIYFFLSYYKKDVTVIL